ncbi:hypothetical protein PsorP6_013633 [Peronosclerospora sorghi]|uniref:Uncharacterized protein n=1 Tax=Peronosclerospora sorghi TaxID=230839 RepID=A0ACC0VIA2_9STRA|nr:hypothetical protein PsorP6_013633 [Peronosclerospora sorghi]
MDDSTNSIQEDFHFGNGSAMIQSILRGVPFLSTVTSGGVFSCCWKRCLLEMESTEVGEGFHAVGGCKFLAPSTSQLHPSQSLARQLCAAKSWYISLGIEEQCSAKTEDEATAPAPSA